MTLLDPEQKDPKDRREVNPPTEVESATWSAGGTLDWWVERAPAVAGRVRGPNGRQFNLVDGRAAFCGERNIPPIAVVGQRRTANLSHRLDQERQRDVILYGAAVSDPSESRFVGIVELVADSTLCGVDPCVTGLFVAINYDSEMGADRGRRSHR